MRSLADYLAKIPPLHATRPKFMAEVALCMAALADAQTFLASLPAAFDLDFAIGVQLDATGAWIGYSRFVPVPIPNAAFSFDTPGLGFDQGYWLGTFGAPATVLDRLDDDTYRRLLYAGRMVNQSDGSIPDIQAALSEYFDTPMAVVDLGGV